MSKRKINYVSLTVEVDIDDLYSDLTTSDCLDIAEKLYEDGLLDEYIGKERNGNLISSVNGGAWGEICDKLANNQLRLTNEEEEIIKKIADRL